MSTMMNTIDPSVIYAPPTIDDLEQDSFPDPEGYYAGQEEYGYDPEEDYVRDNDYDDMYEADFDYGFND
jgi:hypothetical protein